MSLKHGRLRRSDRRKLRRLAREALRLRHDDLLTFLYYLVGHLVEDPDGDLIRDILRDVVPEEEESMVTQTARKWLAEGFNEGLAKGLLEGEAKGEVRGRVEGEARGEARGEVKGRAEMLLRLLRRRFGPLSPEVEARVRSADPDRLDRWSDSVLDARTLSDVFTDG